ncbi:MAG: hypothetical protein ACLR06_07740 [Christensenellaceae bacterium]
MVNVISGKDSFEVSLNYAPAIEAFVQDLKRKNRSRVAFIADTSKTEIEPDTRYIAMRYYAEKYGVGFEESLLRCFEENTVTLNPSEFGYRSIADILQNRSDVDAVYCVNDYIAMGVYKYLLRSGRRYLRIFRSAAATTFFRANIPVRRFLRCPLTEPNLEEAV